MLQRSCSDESFAPVGNTLAMYFGQVISGKLIPLNIESVTGHIDKWLDKDVRLLSEMTMDSMKELFTFLYKYDDRWNEIFVKELPEDLLRLKVSLILSIVLSKICILFDLSCTTDVFSCSFL